MEAVPRLPMLHFDLKVSPEAPAFGPKLKQYIREFYHEDPESYNNEIRTLETLRASAVSSVRNATLASCSALKRYYCQLHFLQSRFPMGKDGAAAVPFTWRDAYATMVCTLPDIMFEMVCILYNIGAVHSYAGASESRDTADGMKLACTHFQCAAWAFQHLKDSYSQPSGVDLAPDIMQFMYQLMLAQAQECILEKSMMDNRKATIIAKVAVQVVDYYKLAQNTLEQGGSEDCSIAETVGSKIFKNWKRYVKFKVSYHTSLSLLYRGQQAEEQQKMGERVALYSFASEMLTVSMHLARGMDNMEIINEALTFTMDVVEGKKKAAKNENEFIYHEEIPDRYSLPEVKGASLVKGIPFDVNDPEVSGPDIFGRLVPMKAHEASSLYSEEKAKLLRKVGAQIEEKDHELVTFMTSLQLEHLNLHPEMERLPQELVDRCAALSAKPKAIQDLIDAMGKLADTYQDVESMLQEIRELLEQEEVREKEYQAVMGSRPPSIAATDLTREARKYEEAHAKASESNQTLHKAMTLNISNLRILALPLPELEKQIPSLRLLDVPLDDPVSQEMRRLVSKVEEMKTQRSLLSSQLRESICQDDITKQLVTRSTEPRDTIFAQELEKHQQYVTLIEQNLTAQDNILKALTDVYAKYAGTRKATTEIIRKREVTISGLISSYDAYEDLLAKSSKGVEFYRKLETNVSKLLQRVKGTCKVQDEEREHILAKNKKSLPSKRVADDATLDAELPVASPGAPKLKDYLESMKRGGYSAGSGSYLNPAYNSQIPPSVSPQPVGSGSVDSIGSQQWIPSVRPAPVGSEGTGEQTPSLCSGISTTLKSVGYTPEDKVPPTAYTHSGSFHYSQFPGSSYPKQYTSDLPDVSSSTDIALKTAYNLNYQQPQQYSYDLSGQAYAYQFPDSTASYSSASQVPSSFTHAIISDTSSPYNTLSQMPSSYQPAASSDNVVPHPNPSHYAPASQAVEQPVQPSASYSSQQSGTALYTARQADAAYYAYSSPSQQAGTLYYPSQYAASYTSMQQAPVSYPCSPSQQTGSVYCMTGQLGSKYPSTTTPSSTTEVRPLQENYCSSYGYDSSGYLPPSSSSYLPPSGVTDYQYMSSDSNISHYTSAGTYDTSQTCSSNKSVDGQTFAAQYSANVRQDVSAQNQYYQSLNTSYQYGSTVEQHAMVNQQQGMFGMPQEMYGQQQMGSYGQQQLTVDQQQASYDQQHVAVGQQHSTISQQLGNYGQQQAAVGQQLGNYGQRQAAVGQQLGNYGQQQVTGGQVQAVVDQQQGMYGQQQATVSQQQGSYNHQQAAPSKPTGETSNVDLLAGLDFTVNQAPLVPQQPAGENTTAVTASPSKQQLTASVPKLPSPTVAPAAVTADPVDPQPPSVAPDVVPPTEEAKDKESKAAGKVPGKDPYSDPESLSQFVQEVEKYEKFVEGLTTKTLNGPTPLDMKWKELLELQEKDAHKHSISVARCYPMKNRFPDILPYDDSRVELPSTKDDYINASYVKDVSALTPPYIVTQAPLPSTHSDFWTMVWEQQVEVVVCLLSNAELEEQLYWPADRAQELVLGKMKLSLQSSNVRPHWTERILSLTVGETRASRIVVHLQFTAWPGSSFPASPGPFLGFVCEALGFCQQQRVASHPVVVHCLSGVGRTGLFVLVTAAVCEVQAGRGLLDLVATAAVMSSHRKSALRDREHLKFAYQALLYYAQDMLMKRVESSSENQEHLQSSEVCRPPDTATSKACSDLERLAELADPSCLRARHPDTKAHRRFSRECFEGRQTSLEATAKPGDPFSDIDPLWPLKRH